MLKGEDECLDDVQSALFQYYTRDILENNEFHSLKDIPNHGTTDLYTHSINVSVRSMKICHRFGLDARAATRGGLLHDFFLYDWRNGEGPGWHGFRHGRISMEESRKRFELTEKEKNMILRHMWPLTPTPPASFEGLVISMVDKFCALEEFMHVDDPSIDDPADEMRSRSLLRKPFIKKGMTIASRFQTLITG